MRLRELLPAAISTASSRIYPDTPPSFSGARRPMILHVEWLICMKFWSAILRWIKSRPLHADCARIVRRSGTSAAARQTGNITPPHCTAPAPCADIEHHRNTVRPRSGGGTAARKKFLKKNYSGRNLCHYLA